MYLLNLVCYCINKPEFDTATDINGLAAAITKLLKSKSGAGSIINEAVQVVEEMGMDDEKAARTLVAMKPERRMQVLAKKKIVMQNSMLFQ